MRSINLIVTKKKIIKNHSRHPLMNNTSDENIVTKIKCLGD